MDDQGTCRGVIALKLDDGRCIAFAPDHDSWHRRYGRAYASCTSAHTAPRRRGMVLRAGLPLQDMEFVSSIRPASTVGLPDTRGARVRRGYLVNSQATLMDAYGAVSQGLARARRSRAMTIEIPRRRVGRRRIISSCTSITRSEGAARTAAGIPIGEDFANVDVTASRSRSCRRCITTWAASPRLPRRGLTKRNGDDNSVVPGCGDRRSGLRVGARRHRLAPTR